MYFTNKYTFSILLIVMAVIGGILGQLTNLPLGALIGTLIFVFLTIKLVCIDIEIPILLKRVIQVLIGGTIGLNINAETIATLKEVWVLAIIIPAIHIVISLIMAYILHKYLKLDYLTSLCSVAPAGIGEMSIMADRFGANTPVVVTTHIFRLLIIVIFVPIIIYIV